MAPLSNEEIVEAPPLAVSDAAVARIFADLPLDERLRRIEAQIIAATLAEVRGNKSKAAVRLGVKRSTLGDRITRCGLRT